MASATPIVGPGAWIRSPAHEYFSTSPSVSDWAAALMLVGLPQAASAHDPALHPMLAMERQRRDANPRLSQAQSNSAFRGPLPARSGYFRSRQ